MFECLDKETEVDGTKCRVRVDGFSDHPKNILEIPDELFFGNERQIELNEIYGTKNKKYKVRGLINILNSYKFAITENTPIEEEIALDPELLGKVFGNLLANFNPETKTTARKQTGSFYTPREIVNYMVDESLLAYLKAKLQTETQGFAGFVAFGENQPTMFGNEGRIQQKFEMPVSNNRWHGKDKSLETALRNLFSYTEDKHQFNETETEILIKAIDNCKILDPACGSGAFPMGILHRLVHLLGKLDKANEKWREWQRLKAIKDTEEAYKIGDHKEREDRLLEINDVFENNASDYGRKLFLIENCIYGVDIQPIAIQIAKLRFFISLIVDQKASDDTDNNLGIRPLPNLETKFVAANTLIGLETNGGLKPNGVTELEKQLKEVRAKHFSARTRKTKEKYRTEDKKIRSEIAELLKQGGINETSADLITDWNPYDQNASAKWFDAEWMFGIEKGFYIVIGNPPYVDIKSLPSNDVKIYFNNFKTAQNRINLYAIFIGQGFKLLNKKGTLTYINPNSLLVNESYEKVRRLILNSISKLIKLPGAIFENAIVETMILILQNGVLDDKVFGKYFKRNDEVNFNIINYDVFSKNEWRKEDSCRFSIFVDKHKTNIVNKMSYQAKPLHDFVEFSLGITPYDKYKGHTENQIKNRVFHSTKKLSNEYVPLPSGKNILKFVIEGVNHSEYLKYGNWLGAPREKKFFTSPKVIVRQILSGKPPSIYAGYTENEAYFTQIGFSIISRNNDRNFLKFSVGLLNSKLLNFYRNFKYLDIEKDIFQKILIANCKQFPIPKATESQQTEIAEIVDEIIEAKKQNPNADTGKLECKIDELVYQLYGLTDEEIRIVEGKDAEARTK